MSLSITSNSKPATASAYAGGKPSPASLQAQLQRFQQQLSDCVNCASAKTAKGKSDIQAIAARISQVRQNIAEADRNQPASPAQAASPAASGNVLQGGTIDVFA